jgi:hypothetical protein
MPEQVKVEIVPLMVGVQDGPVESHAARIGGVEFPLTSFVIERGQNGEVFVSLVVEASSVHIADPATPFGVEPRVPLPAKQEPAKTSTWGDPTVPDPREQIPGWSRPLSASVGSSAQVYVDPQPASATLRDQALRENVRRLNSEGGLHA